MKRKLNVTVLVVGVFFVAQGVAYADSCTSVKREMAFGEAAMEDAKDKAGFKRAAAEFNKATQKAPNCAAAFFNLGVIQEKVGGLAAAKVAYERYLKLSPGAPDAGSVEKQIFKLEYRINSASSNSATSQSTTLWKKLEGKWCRDSCDSAKTIYDLKISNNQVQILSGRHYFTPRNASGCTFGTQSECLGTISSVGIIQGVHNAHSNLTGRGCVSGPGRPDWGNWHTKQYPLSGKVSNNGSLIELQWEEYGDRNRVMLRRYETK